MAMGGDGREQKRLQDLLKMSLKLSDEEMKTYEKTEMDKERKEWLQKAIEHALENDDGKKLDLFSKMLFSYDTNQNLSESQLSDICDILDELNFLIEGRDMAKDFNKLGGLKKCLQVMKSQYTSLQWRSADLIANGTQNNPSCQQTMVDDNGIAILLHILKRSEVDIVRIKCVYAISAIIGEFEPGEIMFIRLKGVNTILKIMEEETGKIKMKSAFLLRKLICKDETLQGLDEKLIFTRLVNLLKQAHDEAHESLAYSFSVLIHRNRGLQKQLQESEDIQKTLRELINILSEDNEANSAEIEQYNSILKLL